MEADSFLKHPIIFGDFIKVAAAREDRVYEDLGNLDKIKSALQDVSQTDCFINKSILEDDLIVMD